MKQKIHKYETWNIYKRHDFEWIMTKMNKNEGENMCIFFMRMIMRIKMIPFTIYFLKSGIYQNSK